MNGEGGGATGGSEKRGDDEQALNGFLHWPLLEGAQFWQGLLVAAQRQVRQVPTEHLQQEEAIEAEKRT